MELREACRLFGLKAEDVAECEGAGILSGGSSDLSDDDVRSVSLYCFLKKAGLSKGEILEYFSADCASCRARILRCLRDRLLDEVHAGQKKLDEVDYLLRLLDR
ncbi:MAG TPA: hypothetical protein H9728_02430 [Candidatus Borkfalkia excrementavium]|uniref:MerR family transcriptional regulator n=1 Tax=Candidatus Borkfalkia excrementavium TaxID=2838505 RepID=A0A9D2CEJ6_9FIRM|nr:hypothetical protein [Candidatus Borkfalkia excrementavium]